MGEGIDKVQDEIQGHAAESSLNGWIALLVAICATFMALCNVKDGNVVQAMQQAQTQAVDQWSFYQAKSTKQHLAENNAELFTVQLDLAPTLPAATRAKLEARIEEAQTKAKKYEKEKEEIRAEAQRQEKAYNDLNVFDDQFDMAEACLTVAIAMFGVTALTKKKPLFLLALTFAGFGLAFGLAGFLHGNLHPNWLAKLLG